MVTTPINTENGFQVGRVKSVPSDSEPAFISFDLNISGALDASLDFATVDQAGVFGLPRTLFFDNATNPNSVEVLVEGTRQQFTIPPLSSGYYPLNCPQKTRILFASAGGASQICNVAIYNHLLPTAVWYADGQITPSDNFAVYGPNAIGLVPTEPPVFMAGVDDTTGFIEPLQLNGDDLRVSVEQSILPPDAATETKQDDILTALALLATEATSADLLASIGDPTDAAWDGIAGSASAIAILKAIWIKLP